MQRSSVCFARRDGKLRLDHINDRPDGARIGCASARQGNDRSESRPSDETAIEAAMNEHGTKYVGTSFAEDLIDESPDALLALSLDGRILAWNRGAELIFGYAAEDAVGRPID